MVRTHGVDAWCGHMAWTHGVDTLLGMDAWHGHMV